MKQLKLFPVRLYNYALLFCYLSFSGTYQPLTVFSYVPNSLHELKYLLWGSEFNHYAFA